MLGKNKVEEEEKERKKNKNKRGKGGEKKKKRGCGGGGEGAMRKKKGGKQKERKRNVFFILSVKVCLDIRRSGRQNPWTVAALCCTPRSMKRDEETLNAAYLCISFLPAQLKEVRVVKVLKRKPWEIPHV